MLPETVRNYIHDHQSEAVETLSKLIGFPSVATPQPTGFPTENPLPMRWTSCWNS